MVRLAELLDPGDVATFLRRVVASGRYGNAYLFHGAAGVGKGTAALAFARAALCERVPGAAPVAAPATAPAAAPLLGSLFGDAPAAAPPPSVAALGDDACGECAACLKSANLRHPDLKFLFPVSGEEKDLDVTIAETLEAMRKDPLFVFAYEKAASIRMSMTRELQRELAYRPYESSRRVVVVRDADRMREDQYSALLKSIEEPGAATLWVLTTSRLSRIPATIRSRCQRVRFAALGETRVERFLVERADVAPAEAQLLAALSSGSLARALVLREGSAVEQRDAALALLGPALNNFDPAALWKASQGAARFGKAGRESLRRALEFHLLWLRDLLRARYGAADTLLANRDRAGEIHALAQKVDAAAVRRRVMVVEEALRAIDGNISVDLTLFSALARIGGQPLGEGAWPAHGAARITG